MLTDKKIVITGGTGSLGKVLLRRLLSGEMGKPKKIVVFSRDEAKQHELRVDYQHRKVVTDEVIYNNFEQLLEFQIGDVRDYSAVCGVLKGADVVFNAAALKQVPACEYFPFEAVRTNVEGPNNIVRAIRDLDLKVQTVIGISTDKAAKPVNVMGMTKALQERVFLRANIDCPDTRFIVVRYGNVLASRGSVIPLFHEQINNGGPLTITSEEMTRFLLSLDDAVDLIFAAMKNASRGETYIPRVPTANIKDLALELIGERDIDVKVTGIRPGEKLHEILISEEEVLRTVERGNHYVILPILPEIVGESRPDDKRTLSEEYSSEHGILNRDDVRNLLKERQLMIGDAIKLEGEFLR
ncbi:polysaccharide biosynthesis protein [Kiloniella majae]|uniref:polysaccharide biosynthesis protein n=1 Tax=Kiloniella majae TaxID=1938558 RepID=UPI000A2794EC|nr:polysaccharide biosynthesis protein [Kiloniella majae]